ncbi:MAG: cell division protein SepF [Xylanivirga thermophila]|jgi:cell division inhibitor SepF|uniref:cell division protein SepF n=1 Tax=Xylanivirga thermophila TaxID=2496273 RepID=UPI00101CAC2B|nr:cell division protein SepF [Xylanivirga thermophila]
MAGKMFDKFLNIIGLEESIMDEDEDMFLEEQNNNMDDDFDEPIIKTKQKKGKVVNIHSASYVKVIVYQPFSYDDTQTIIDNLKSRKPVIVNLEALDIDLAQRVLDFMSGAVYALDGTIHKVSKGIFVLAPSNVDISGNIPEELKGKSFFTLTNNKEKGME